MRLVRLTSSTFALGCLPFPFRALLFVDAKIAKGHIVLALGSFHQDSAGLNPHPNAPARLHASTHGSSPSRMLVIRNALLVSLADVSTHHPVFPIPALVHLSSFV